MTNPEQLQNKKRRLIVCCDGTWQDLDQPYPTNVVKMAQRIKLVDDQGIRQIIYYDEGLGTKQMESKTSITNSLTKLGGGGLGLGIDHKIRTAYRFLCMNYEPGDEIYLFGFSRGSYTVRCLAGLIYNSGLPRRECFRKIPEAYEIYRDKEDRDQAPSGSKAVKFREKYGQKLPIDPTEVRTDETQIPITALCCWDTVASLGVPNLIPFLNWDEKFNQRYSFFDYKVNRTIKRAIHGVAIDEIRKLFDVTPMESSIDGQLTQVWFPGGHGCVGGGTKADRGLSDGALLWMMEQVKTLGLALNEDRQEDNEEYGIKPDCKVPFDNTSKFPFNIGGPNIRKVTGTFADLHESVKQRWKHDSNYRPENLIPFEKELDAWNP